MSQSVLSVADAQKLILDHAAALPAEIAPLTSTTLGLVLAEEVRSDIDMPPYTKALMDGYAVRSADLPEGKATLTIIEEVMAGQTPMKELAPGQATRIMTGAPIPQGADAVIQVERTQTVGANQVQIEDRPTQPGQNILPQASEIKEGDVVLAPGKVLRPPEFGVLAAVGKTSFQVIPPPRIHILSTGDEVVEANQRPRAGQIRNSNGPLLLAQACRAGGLPRYLGIARDTIESLQSLLREGLQADMLILSGGVSAGKLDLVPGALQQAGVTAQMHKVAMKPGKPAFFGTRPQSDPRRPPTLVFGLPGNPVGALVCFELFVRPAIRKLGGHANPLPETVDAVLTEDRASRTDRPTYHPAHLEAAAAGWQVRLVPWFGSADLRALTSANALALLPPGDHQHRAGQTLSVLRLTE